MKVTDSITDLTVARFVDVVVNGNLAALIVEGLPENDEDISLLEDAWKKITQEYSDSMGTQEYMMYLNMLRKVSLLNLKYQLLLQLIDVMGNFPFEVLGLVEEDDRNAIKSEIGHFGAEVNKILSAELPFNLSDLEGYMRDLKRANSMGKRLKLSYDIETANLEALQKKNGDVQEKHTKEYFQSMLITLGDYKNIVLTDEITVYQFCDRVRRFNEHQAYLSRARR